MKKFTVNFDEVRNRGIPIDVFLYILCLYFRLPTTQETIKEAHHSGLTVKDIDQYIISKDGILIVQDILASSALLFKRESEKSYYKIAQQLADLFPNGIKPNTSSYWKGSIENIAYRLKLLELKIGRKLPNSKILQATKEYLKVFKEDKTYMQTLPYFIFKYSQNPDGEIEWQSNLLSAVENLKENERTNR